jgi:hypothetical protein
MSSGRSIHSVEYQLLLRADDPRKLPEQVVITQAQPPPFWEGGYILLFHVNGRVQVCAGETIAAIYTISIV